MWPPGRIARGGVGDEPVDGRGDIRNQGGRRRNVLVEVAVGHLQRAGALERGPAGEQLEEHDSAGVDVGTSVGYPAGHLLGSQVGHGAEQQAGGRRERRRVDRPGEAEVADLDRAVVGDQHVFRLDVTVHEPGAVGRGECLKYRQHHLKCLSRLQMTGLAKHLTQRATLDQLHDQEDDVAVLALICDGDDVGAGQPGGGLGLAPEAGDEVLVGGEGRMHGLDRHRTVEPGVEGAVHHSHPAGGDAPGDFVATVEQPTQHGVD